MSQPGQPTKVRNQQPTLGRQRKFGNYDYFFQCIARCIQLVAIIDGLIHLFSTASHWSRAGSFVVEAVRCTGHVAAQPGQAGSSNSLNENKRHTLHDRWVWHNLSVMTPVANDLLPLSSTWKLTHTQVSVSPPLCFLPLLKLLSQVLSLSLLRLSSMVGLSGTL